MFKSSWVPVSKLVGFKEFVMYLRSCNRCNMSISQLDLELGDLVLAVGISSWGWDLRFFNWCDLGWNMLKHRESSWNLKSSIQNHQTSLKSSIGLPDLPVSHNRIFLDGVAMRCARGSAAFIAGTGADSTGLFGASGGSQCLPPAGGVTPAATGNHWEHCYNLRVICPTFIRFHAYTRRPI